MELTVRKSDKGRIVFVINHNNKEAEVDFGTDKLKSLIDEREFTGKNLRLSFTSGTEFPEELSSYRLIIHCGGCMLNEREMRYRIQTALDAGVPVTNYGPAIAYMNGILKKSGGIAGHSKINLSEET